MGRVKEVRVEKLAQGMTNDNMDLVKVVLTQPFKKILSYEVSCIALSGLVCPCICQSSHPTA